MSWLKKVFENYFLLMIILLNIFDFLEYLPEDLDFIKKIISWGMMIYLLYHFSFTKILIGYKNKKLDLSLVLAYTLFILKDLFFYISHAEFNFEIFEKMVLLLKLYQGEIAYWSFNLSAGIIILISFLLVKKYDINIKSMLGTLTLNKRHGMIRFFGNLISISFIAYFIFMMIFQWFTIVIDAPLVMIGLVYTLFAMKRDHNIHLMHKVADFGENILEKFIELFHFRSTIHLGIVSLLVLHFFTDFFVFIIPTIIVIKDSLYYNVLQTIDYTNIFNLFFESIKNSNTYEIINIAIVYLSNIIFIFIVFLTPLIIIKDLYNKQKIKIFYFINLIFIPVFFVYYLFPMYKFLKINNLNSNISGVNIILLPIKETPFLNYIAIIFIISIFIIYAINKIFKELDLSNITLALLLVPMISYVSKYFTSTIFYQVELIKNLIMFDNILIIIFLFIFLFLIVMFYWPAMILLIYEIFKTNHIHLLPKHIDHEKVHNLIEFLISFLFLYLGIYFVSTIFAVFNFIRIFDFFIPIILTLTFLILAKYSNFFPKISFLNNNKSNLFFIPASLLVGLFCGISFIYFRENFIFMSKNIYLLVTFLIFVAISEEILFRHYLQHYLSDIFSFKKSMIIQSIFFSFIHIPKGVNFNILISLFAFSILATLIKEKKGLLNAIIMHFFTNLILYGYFLGLF